jgi:uncharacterized protein YicC (UPF0701 family)
MGQKATTINNKITPSHTILSEKMPIQPLLIAQFSQIQQETTQHIKISLVNKHIVELYNTYKQVEDDYLSKNMDLFKSILIPRLEYTCKRYIKERDEEINKVNCQLFDIRLKGSKLFDIVLKKQPITLEQMNNTLNNTLNNLMYKFTKLIIDGKLYIDSGIGVSNFCVSQKLMK